MRLRVPAWRARDNREWHHRVIFVSSCRLMWKLDMNSAAVSYFFEWLFKWLYLIDTGVTAARYFSSSAAIMKSVSYYCADHQYHQNRHRHHLSLPSTAIVTSVRTWRHTSGPTWFRISCEANWLSCLIYPPGLCWSVSARIIGHGTDH